MGDLLKKLGVPSAVAALVALLVTVIPMILKADSRYTKEEDFHKSITELTEKVNALTSETGRIAGTTQVLVAVLASKDQPARLSSAAQAVEPTRTAEAVVPAPVAASAPDEVHVAISTVPPKNAAETRERLSQLNSELDRSQRVLMKLGKSL
jgi:hypothetical protein